jgi:hypothetical protein
MFVASMANGKVTLTGTVKTSSGTGSVECKGSEGNR